MGLPVEMFPAAMKTDGVRHGKTNPRSAKQQEREETEQSRKVGPSGVSHLQHYHWYGAGKSMFLIYLDTTSERARRREMAPSALCTYIQCIYIRGSAMRSRISKWGNSLAVRIPRNLLEASGLADGDSIELAGENGRLVITPVFRQYGLDELVEGITPENRHTETDWGPPQGAERW